MALADIKSSLVKLDEALNVLEDSVESYKAYAESGNVQYDMFAVSNKSIADDDKQKFITQIDTIIEKTQKILDMDEAS
ncbi:MAG: hypothetical protein CL565_01065 [Alphaproteobacteria bacterium]|nr:hypothetical protein [Alphaproteobacteria bacterium]|tara:strand:- start:100 stop:333 length:234 start_codon:yes stop_codon:yes gene_type:complete